MAVSLYAFMVVSRLAEAIPFAATLRPMVILAAAMVALALFLPQSQAYRLFRPVEARGMVAIFLLIGLSIPTSYWPGASFGALLNYSKSLVFFFAAIYCIRTRSELRLALWSFLAAIAGLAFVAVVAGGSGRVLVTKTYDTNDLAFVMVCGIPLAILLVFSERGWQHWILALVALLGTLTVILSKSRGGFIALAVVGLVTLIKIPSRVPFLRTGFVLAVVLVFSLIAPSSYWERISTIWGGESAKTAADEYLQGGFETARWQIWKNGLILIASRPILGVGAGAFVVAEGSLHNGGKWNAAHNSFIQITAELGLPGLGVFLFLLYRGFANCRRVIRATRRSRSLAGHFWMAHGLEASLCGYVVAGSALSQAYSDIFYFLLAMSVILVRLTASRLQGGGRLTTAPRPATGPWWRRRK
jgi:O-antigen ligase